MAEHFDEANFAKQVGARLAALRDAHGWTQQDVADKLGVNRLTIVHMEAGRRPPNAWRLLVLADLYGVTVDNLLGRDVSDDRRAWAALLELTTGRNLFDDRPELQQLAASLSSTFTRHAWDMVRSLARERVKP